MEGVYYQEGDRSIPAAFIGFFLEMARSNGVDLRGFLGTPRSVDGGCFSTVSLKDFSPIYKECVKAVRSACGFSHLSFDCADLMCACILGCGKLGEAIARANKFVEVLGGRGMRLGLDVNESRTVLKFLAPPKRGGVLDAAICDFIEVCFYHKLFSWLIGEPLTDGAVELAHSEWGPGGPFLEEVMGSSIVFNQGQNAIIFDTEILKRPIVRISRDLDEVLQVSPIELMPLPPAKKLSVILTGIFRRSLDEKGQLPQVDDVAYQLGQSGPTLRRHLAKENTSFQELVDKCRMEKASELLRDSKLTIDDISHRLGFSAPSGFSRAFKDWTGCAPSIYRQRQEPPEEERIAVGYR